MITREEAEVAKAIWGEAKITHTLSISGLGLLKQNATAIIHSVIALGFSQVVAVKEFEKYEAAQQTTVKSSLEAIIAREEEYAKANRAYKAQKQSSTSMQILASLKI
ncbi:hypothetical protein [Pseudomonas synxantha]|uniref:Uncharacterized protein n=1 Tax=Pseudomonas synxantha TaxID=47883 RepID=A0ABS0UQS9_9PSED|nr:hypothetical protein [Pseudomonas synxantha]MBI6567946.1 hypothetical protein [Pseudomonas synxantha]MBI6584201.1 hypothetical protein [Pseudomonas synxantha]MBI6646576.1 hypothetical protein [Pseudomonas synxantha]